MVTDAIRRAEIVITAEWSWTETRGNTGVNPHDDVIGDERRPEFGENEPARAGVTVIHGWPPARLPRRPAGQPAGVAMVTSYGTMKTLSAGTGP